MQICLASKIIDVLRKLEANMRNRQLGGTGNPMLKRDMKTGFSVEKRVENKGLGAPAGGLLGAVTKDFP